MLWQIISEIAAFLFVGKALPFVIGLVVGGMLAVGNDTFYEWMDVVLGWWFALVGMLIGSTTLP